MTKKKGNLSIIKETILSERILFILALVLFAGSFFLRFVSSSNFLPYYSLDENELTEFALGLFGPDKDPHWYKYGPLYWYLLKGVYSVQLAFSSLSTNAFVEGYFIDPTRYFATSRDLASLFHLLCGVVGFLIAYFHLNKKAALIVFCFGIIPFGDSITSFLPRIDTLLALNTSLCFLFALFLLKKGKRDFIYFIFSGMFLAFCVSTKPIPSLLILPALGILFYCRHLPKEINAKNLFIPFISLIKDWGSYIFLLSVVVGLYVSNPYMFKSFDAFWNEQVMAIKTEGSRDFASGMNVFLLSSSLGYLYIIAGISSCLYAVYDGVARRKFALMILGVYILTYWGAFAAGAARNYFYVPLTVTMAILVGYYLRRISHYLVTNKVLPYNASMQALTIIGFLILTIWPLYNISANRLSIINAEPLNDHVQVACEYWIKENIPANSKILYYGYYTSMARLFDNNINDQAQYGDYFMYGRGKNKYWIERYRSAFQSITSNKEIKKYDLQYNLNYKDPKGETKQFYTRYKNEEISKVLFQLSAAQDLTYIVSVYDLPEETGEYDLIAKFDRESYAIGSPIKVFKKRTVE